MNLRFPLAVAAALVGAAGFAGPALAIEQIYIPDPNAAQNSGPPDALFDNSIPTTWQKKADDQKSGSGFHFTVRGSSGQGQPLFGEDAKVPGSEFQLNGTPVQNPYFLQSPYFPK